MRLKIIAGNLVLVLLIGVVGYFIVDGKIRDTLSAEINSDIESDATLLERSFRLSGTEFLNHTVDRASIRELRSAFNAVEEQDQRRRVFNQAEAIAQWFRDPSRNRGGPPDIVVVTDQSGSVIARDKDINNMHGRSILATVPSLRDVIQDGRPRHDVWFKEDENKLLQIAIAAIRNETGATIGALVVGYDLSNGVAEAESRLLGDEVAFLVAGRVYSSSMHEQAEALRTVLFETQQAATEGALDGQRSPTWVANIGGNEYIGITGELPMTPSGEVAYALLGNRSEALALADVSLILLILAVIGALLVAVYGFIIGSSFLRPLEQIEEGVLGVINGRTDIRIDVESGEFGGLAYRINQLINVFTGVAEEDEEGRMTSSAPGAPESGSGWQGSAFTTADPSATPGTESAGRDVVDDPEVAAKLAAEPEDAYFARVYREYVDAKQAAGEDVSSIPQDRFVKRLQANAAALAKKHGVPAVRFQVQTKGNQVILRPVLLR